MDALAAADISLFEGFRLDRRSGVLFRRDQQGVFTPITIGRRALDILGVLVERPGDLVTRDEIIEAVWPGTVVEDSNLNVQVAALRRILDQNREQSSCIQTVPGRGYRFVAPVTRVERAASPASALSTGSGSDGLMAENEQAQGPGLLRQIGRIAPTPRPRGRHPLWGRVMATVIGAVVLVAAVVTVLNWRSLWPGNALQAPRLSIVVLPFTNLSDDRKQQYFADGITEDLTTDLSRIAGMFVIDRNTAFTYRDKTVEASQIGRELRVRYVLEGSVQRSGSQLRITAQLIEADTGGHLWAERFDRDTGDLFALQDEITGRIAAALSLELVSTEATRPTDHPEVLDYIFQARATYHKGPGSDAYAETVSLYEHALALDPLSVEALAGLGGALAARVMLGFADSPTVDLERGERVITQALAISPRNPLAHYAKAIWLKAQGRCEEAIPEFEMLMSLNRNSVNVLANLGQCKILIGSMDEGVALQEQVIRLSPRDPYNGNRYFAIGMAHLLQSRTDEAIDWLEKGRNLSPRLSFPHAYLASAYALKGDLNRAAAELAEARRLSRDGRFSSIARLMATGNFGVPKVLALAEATYFAGLRKAGMPED
jgi:TolB-like protein/DNA-binding winged helix-turn-helix (wHTH) protein/Tfp pilus assembly protein PilF